MASSDRTPIGFRRSDPDETQGRLLYRQRAEAAEARIKALEGENERLDAFRFAAVSAVSSLEAQLLMADEAVRAAKALCDNINEFGQVTDAELYDSVDATIRRAAEAHARLLSGKGEVDG